MGIFVVAYDLNTQGQNYTCITGKLKAMNHCYTQKSLWFVEFSGDESALVNHLGSCLDKNDRLFVTGVSDIWAGMGMPTCGKWLNNHGL